MKYIKLPDRDKCGEYVLFIDSIAYIKPIKCGCEIYIKNHPNFTLAVNQSSEKLLEFIKNAKTL